MEALLLAFAGLVAVLVLVLLGTEISMLLASDLTWMFHGLGMVFLTILAIFCAVAVLLFLLRSGRGARMIASLSQSKQEAFGDVYLGYGVKRKIGIVLAAAGLFLIGISAPPNPLPDFKAFVFVFSALWLCLLHKDFGLEKPGPYPWEFPVLRIALTLGSAATAAFVPGCTGFVFVTLLSVFCWYA